jgi:hypothetical protein
MKPAFGNTPEYVDPLDMEPDAPGTTALLTIEGAVTLVTADSA